MIFRTTIWCVFIAVLCACSASRVEKQQPIVTEPSPETLTVSPDDTVIYYARGACFGMCPIFELTVFRDGKATYLGKNHVDRIGRYEAQVGFSDVEHIRQKAMGIGYFSMQSEYDNEHVQDLPNIITAIDNDSKLYRVRNRYKGPTALRVLYTELDSLIERQAWKPTGKIQQD